MLAGVRRIIANLIDANATVLDIGCGTGELVFYLSRQATRVVGVDTNDEVLECARIKKKKLQIENVEFVSKDAKDSNLFSETHFDYIVLSMVLHQFSLAEANQVLKLAKRIAKYIILADFAHPLPKNVIGWGATLIERKAGGQHYLNFKDYQKQGGLNYFLDYHQLAIMENRIGGLGDIWIIKTLSGTFQEDRTRY